MADKTQILIELLKIAGEKRKKIDINTYLDTISSDPVLNQSEADYQTEQAQWLKKIQKKHK